jgi:hypothetical protein
LPAIVGGRKARFWCIEWIGAVAPDNREEGNANKRGTKASYELHVRFSKSHDTWNLGDGHRAIRI